MDTAVRGDLGSLRNGGGDVRSTAVSDVGGSPFLVGALHFYTLSSWQYMRRCPSSAIWSLPSLCTHVTEFLSTSRNRILLTPRSCMPLGVSTIECPCDSTKSLCSSARIDGRMCFALSSRAACNGSDDRDRRWPWCPSASQSLLAVSGKAEQGCTFLRTSFRRSVIMDLLHVGKGDVHIECVQDESSVVIFDCLLLSLLHNDQSCHSARRF